jgi:hypothetical protein
MPGPRSGAAPAGSLRIWILVSRFCVDGAGAAFPRTLRGKVSAFKPQKAGKCLVFGASLVPPRIGWRLTLPDTHLCAFLPRIADQP